MIWLGIWVGSLMRTVEAVQGFMFTVMFPLTFLANTFVPTESLPDGLRQFAEANPFTTFVDATRHLFLGTPAHSDVWMSWVWIIGITVVAAFFAVRRYRSLTS